MSKNITFKKDAVEAGKRKQLSNLQIKAVLGYWRSKTQEMRNAVLMARSSRQIKI